MYAGDGFMYHSICFEPDNTICFEGMLKNNRLN